MGARPNTVSYNNAVAEMPSFLNRYFSQTNLILIYPEQFGERRNMTTFVDPLSTDINSAPSPLWIKINTMLRRANTIKRRPLGR
ncbi:MAG: hypothetical protein K2M76_01010, partial [Muribaculaceae bacterium]|nr:hypothetical protein [Muribaculaceae bacterium]